MDTEAARLLRESKDRQDIYDCLVRYCRAIDRLDRELLTSVYHSDAIDDHGFFVGPVDGFVDWVLEHHGRAHRWTQFSITNHYCELSGDIAHTESYWAFVGAGWDSPEHIRAQGRYVDRFERRAGRWAIAERVCLMESEAAGDNPGDETVFESSTFERSARDRSDTSYRRPLSISRSRFTQAR